MVLEAVPTPILVLCLMFLVWGLAKITRLHITYDELQVSQQLGFDLSKLDFFHAFFYGRGDHTIDDHEFYSDATYTLVVTLEGTPSALIGFEVTDDTLVIYQLQGLRRVNVRGVELGSYLLECVEKIAKAYRKKRIWIQPAWRHTYYELDELSRLYKDLYKHQARLRAMYDTSASRHGYEPAGGMGPSFRVKWWEKTLHQRVTVSRTIRVHVALFNRQLRSLYRNGMVEEFY